MPLHSLNRLTLKSRIALSTAVVFIGFVTAMAFMGLRYFETEFRKNLYAQQFALISSIATSLDDKLRMSQETLISRAALIPHDVLTNADKAQRHLDGRAVLIAMFDNGLFLLGPDGKLIAESPRREGRRGRDISFREFVQATIRTQKPYISKPFLTAFSPAQPAVVMTAPLLDKNGKLIGILEGSFNLLGRNFLADQAKIRIGETGYIYIADQDRVTITHPDPARIMKPGPQPGQNQLFDKAFEGFEGSGRTVTSVGVEMYSSFKRLKTTGWILSANYPVAEAEAPLQKVKTYFTLVLALGTLVVLAVTWLIVKNLTAPLASLTQHVQQLSMKSDIDRRLNLSAGGEVGTLITAFNTMVDAADRQQRTLVESETRFRSLAEMSTDWYWEQDTNFRFSLMSRGVEKTNVTTGLGQTRWELPIVNVTPEQWAEHRAMLDRHEPLRNFVYQIRAVDGELHTFAVSGNPMFDANGVFTGYRGIGADITDRKAAEQRIEYLAYHDTLTGLPNRLLAQDRFEQAMAHAERKHCKVALVFLDLDSFKTINDTLGHAAGDEVLKEVARRLRDCVRDSDTISRQGGDEFLVVLGDLPDTEVVSDIILKIMERLQEPLHVEAQELSSTVSVGVAIGPDDGRDFETLLKKADLAMYRSKESGRNAYHFFDPTMDAEAGEHLLMRNGLRHAVERQEFALHYQPQFDLTSGAVVGVEALLRWNHPELGMVAPARFIPVAEESGLIVPIGNWVLREACRQAVIWRTAGLPELSMAVNLSAVQFRRGDIEQSVIDALEFTGFKPDLLELELTESILIQNAENVLASIKRLKLLGVKISIDDFGTGYSSLSYLKRFDVDKLKIDQSFIRDLATDPDDAAIVRAIIQMAHSLNLRTIAEGVESMEMLEQLRKFQCDEAQGYYFARPLPAQEMGAFLAQRRANQSIDI
jgi:diguanylate cyclase (GGDEF)-like protein/PAS domain S-box-containing protein